MSAAQTLPLSGETYRHHPPAARPAPGPRLAFRDLVIDTETRRVLRAGRLIQLTAVEYALLLHFATRPGRIIPHRDLLNTINPRSTSHDKQSVRNLIWRLRRKIEENPGRPAYICTSRGEGYRFLA